MRSEAMGDSGFNLRSIDAEVSQLLASTQACAQATNDATHQAGLVLVDDLAAKWPRQFHAAIKQYVKDHPEGVVDVNGKQALKTADVTAWLENVRKAFHDGDVSVLEDSASSPERSAKAVSGNGRTDVGVTLPSTKVVSGVKLGGGSGLGEVLSTYSNQPLTLPGQPAPVFTGWLPEAPDPKDYTETHPEIVAMAKKLGIWHHRGELPAKVDLRKWFPPVFDQGKLGSCTANAGDGVIEYFEKRSSGDFVVGSRLYIYKFSRELLGFTGDTGATLRATMAAMALGGVPPEQYEPYNIDDFEKEPTTFQATLAANVKPAKYFTHDPDGAKPEDVINSVKKWVAAGVPAMFGFEVFPSMKQGDVKGAFPVPGPDEKPIGGHAICVAGYDDSMKITNKKTGKVSTGAFLIRNSWGPSWGDGGYGWVPYDYVRQGVAGDFWSILDMNWVNTNKFGLASPAKK